MTDTPDDAAIRAAHRFDPRTGNCTCGWEPSSDRGLERLHAKHVERVVAGQR